MNKIFVKIKGKVFECGGGSRIDVELGYDRNHHIYEGCGIFSERSKTMTTTIAELNLSLYAPASCELRMFFKKIMKKNRKVSIAMVSEYGTTEIIMKNSNIKFESLGKNAKLTVESINTIKTSEHEKRWWEV